MKEVSIPLELSNPVDFFGVNDVNLKLIRKQFPGLKVISRGNALKLIGEPAQIDALNKKLVQLIAHFETFGRLSQEEAKELLSNTGESNGYSKSDDVLVYGTSGLVVKSRSANQENLVKSSEKNDIVFAIGPAGTGKTYTAVALAVRALKNKQVRKIVLTRPAVEAGESLGFLPGDLKEKIDPYLRPLYDALYDMIPSEKLNHFIETHVIEVAPLAFMRGRTLDNAFVILDEAQNATENQLKMFLTRMGPSAKFIVTGDYTQIDLPPKQKSGLLNAPTLFKGIKGIDFIHFDEKDVVRHQLVKDIIKAYERK